jgi:hypothetical protein
LITATEFNFTLPKGLVDADSTVHRHGVMRLATAKDEIAVQKDRRTQESEAYGALIMFSRVITQLGHLSNLSPELLENLFTNDLGYLREFYNRINQQETAEIPVRCPVCSTSFKAELSLAGES